jgi:ATP-dependent helicase/DNAse subunit B
MPLTLVTGPANAEKARLVLGRVGELLEREPILVVPTFPDVERYRRELAEDHGLVFGPRVETFDRLLGEIARRAGVAGRALRPLARERVATAAAADARLTLLARSAETPGFAGAACRLFDELEAERVAPGRFFSALRSWAEEDEARRAYGEELGRLYGAYRDRLAALGRTDETLHRAAALDAIREERARWGTTPVLFYGFDDLTVLQRDAILALATTDAEVTVSLTYEAGRHAFAARGEAYHALAPAAAKVVELEPNAAHYAEGSRRALHHLERRLFEEDYVNSDVEVERQTPDETPALTLFDDLAMRTGVADPLGSEISVSRSGGAPEPVSAGAAITLLEGGGERAEVELVAAEVARLVRDEGVAPDEIAVVFRRPDAAAALVGQVFDAYGIRTALPRTTRLGHTPLGRALVALLRAATGGTAQDLLAYLRAPGLADPAAVDTLESDIRRHGAKSAAEARRLWDRRHPEHPVWDAVDRVAAAHDEGSAELLAALGRELAGLFAAPHVRQAPVLDGSETAEAQVLAAGRRALRDLGDAAALDPALVPGPAELARILGEVEVRIGEREAPGAVQITDPQQLRARRVRALFLCHLQEKVFPAPAAPEPFLGDDERRAINAASGLRLRAHEDVLGSERYLLYATVSRPEERLYLAWHAADDEGDPDVRSAFVDDVARLFADDPLGHRRRRDLGAVGWAQASAPCERERLRAEAHALPPAREEVAQPLAHPAVLADLRAKPAWAASALETYASCPVKWFVERHLRPGMLEPDPEAMVRGTLAHKVLEEALRRLVDGGGLTPARLPEAREAVREALGELHAQFKMSVDPSRLKALRRRLEADLLRYVEAAAYSGTQFVPVHLEAQFAELDAGDGILLRGQVDRIDRRPGTNEALLYDYKGKTAYPAAAWEDEGRFQLAVYALAARRLLDLEPVGALYQPLGADDLRPRGALRDDADPDLNAVKQDRLSAEEFEALLTSALDAALRAARGARAGELVPQPDTCAWGGGCAYPTICRCEA